MKIRSLTWTQGILPVVLIASFGWVGDALAADGMKFTRETYDLIMRYANFLILAGVIYKFGRAPIIKFLSGQSDDVASTIEKFEGKKKSAQKKIKESQKLLKASDERLVKIKEKIIAEGERRKTALIADAQDQSRAMLESAKAKIEGQIREAYALIKAELIDTATEQAVVKLPQMITVEDHEHFIRLWIDAAEK